MSENTTPPTPEEAPSFLTRVLEKRPFRAASIQVQGKWLSHDDQMRVMRHFLASKRDHLRAHLKDTMIGLSVLGETFSKEEWAQSMDGYNGDLTIRPRGEAAVDGPACAEPRETARSFNQ